MKKICIILGLMLIATSAMGQKNQLDDMILTSINSYISWEDSIFAKTPGYNSQNRLVGLCVDGLGSTQDLPYDSLRQALSRFQLFSLNNARGLSKSMKRLLAKGLYSLFVSTKLDKDQIIIKVTTRTVTVKTKKKVSIYLGICNWGIYSYSYAAQADKWILKNTKYGGI